jgi:hypothetical protein
MLQSLRKCSRSDGAEECVRLRNCSVASCDTNAAPHKVQHLQFLGTNWTSQYSIRTLLVSLDHLLLFNRARRKSCLVRQAAMQDTFCKMKAKSLQCMNTVQYLNCGFTSDRPFAYVLQKTDVIRDAKDSARTANKSSAMLALQYTEEGAPNRLAMG